ncbi:MAG: ATP-grasp domain-containing protein [Candidatus Hermodarchaeota archaeon]
MKKNKLFIFEFISGGGFINSVIPNSLFCEGFGMLRSIIEDFSLLDFEIYTMIDSRISFLSKLIKADHLKEIKKDDNFMKIFKELVRMSQYVFIIAPEFSNILYRLTKIVKDYDRIILSTNLKAIEYGTSKIISYNIFKTNKIKTPKTYRIPYKEKCLDIEFILHKFNNFKKPIVIKPEDGVGAEDIHYFENETQILNFFRQFNLNLEEKRNYIIQEFISGRDLSLSLIGSPNLYTNPLVLSINSQNIDIKNKEPEYLGGYTPLENYKQLLNQISHSINKLNDLNIEGYFGIDIIGNFDFSVAFIEINPRLTTSYIGLRKILDFNCAELIFNSKIKYISEFQIEFSKCSYFTRIDFSSKVLNNKELKNEVLITELMKKIPEMVTPPISLNNTHQFSCFVATETKDLRSSKIRLNEILQTLENLNFDILKPKKLILL